MWGVGMVSMHLEREIRRKQGENEWPEGIRDKSINENDRRILGVCILFVTQTTWTYSVEAKTNDAYSSIQNLFCGMNKLNKQALLTFVFLSFCEPNQQIFRLNYIPVFPGCLYFPPREAAC